MTFREFMIQKLEAHKPTLSKKETKFAVSYFIPRTYSSGFYEIKIPKPGTKYYTRQMIDAMTKFSSYFPSWGKSLIETLAKMILEKEEQEANEK